MACIWYGVQAWIGGKSMAKVQLNGAYRNLRRMCHPHDYSYLEQI